MLRSLCLSISLAAAATVAVAQTPNHLVGLTRLGDLRHESHASCSVLGSCSPAGFPNSFALPFNAGGTAWDSIRGGAWISNGQWVACVDDTCNYICSPAVVPGMGPGAYVCGLEVVESRNELWLVDSAGWLRAMSRTCPPVTLWSCQISFVSANYLTTGLAVDELRGVVFYSRVDATRTTDKIAYADLATPCSIIQGITVQPCFVPTVGFTGLACDAGAHALYATDGQRTVSIDYTWVGGGLTLAAPNCCPPAGFSPDPMVGLAVRPGRATSAGMACANGSCANCAMTHGLKNDSVLGNGQFGLQLDNAPVGSLAWCLIGAGPCAVPGVPVAQLCGPIYTSPLLTTLGFVAVNGAGGCGGSADFPLPLPPATWLAGAVLSSQCVTMCLTPFGFGTSVSNCLSFELQGI